MTNSIEARIAALDWAQATRDLDDQGRTVLLNLMSSQQCRQVAALYEEAGLFRKQIDMARHGYGRGDYRYFAYPLPAIITELREALYPHLAPVANRWYERLRLPPRFPDTLADFLDRCHQAGQLRPTPLLLNYGPGDYNCLHQDLYGEHVFPIQAAILLSAPQQDFTGGEFILTEQRPRMQSKVEAVPIAQGDAVLFAVNARPRTGARGDYRVAMRHGVSTVREGQRRTLGIIFHDAA